MHPSTQRIRDIVVDANIETDVRELTESTRTAKEAASALGCDVGAIASSLVFLADGAPIMVLTSGAHRVDTDHLAAQIGANAITRASADDVRAATGQPIGGVAPVGHPTRFPIYLDTSLSQHSVLWAAAGTPRSVFSVSYGDLLRLTGAVEVTVTPAGG